MKRGPYKSYLGSDGNGVMPRSTFYDKLKRLRCDITDGSNEVHNKNIADDNTNEIDPFSQKNIFGENDIHLIETTAETDCPLINVQSSITTDSVFNSWLYEDYDEESSDREIFFDAEDSSPEDNCHVDNRNEQNQAEETDDLEDNFKKPLCSCSAVTRGEALMMTLALGAEESLTWKSIIAILSLINTLFQDDVVPASKYKLLKTVKLNEEILTYHIFCTDCHNYFGARNKFNREEFKCEVCVDNEESPDVNYFLTFGVAAQLKAILEDEEVQEVLMESLKTKNQKCNNILRNMSDGELYKKLLKPNNPLSGEYNLSYTFNTDGCQPSKSSKVSIWPIYACINELPPKLQSKHMIMIGLWADKSEPDMLLFLKPFVDEMNELSEVGVQWNLRQQIITSKFIPICAVVDSVARCKILNMKQYNGTYGCTYCEHPTERVGNSTKFPMAMVVPKERTDESIKKQMVQAAQDKYGKDVMGVWGPSQLMNLKYFDIVDGMSPDYMHAILLGVIKQHSEILFTAFGKDYYVGNPNQLEALNVKLLSFKHPSCITRSPRSLHEREMWKATEWRSWLLFYSLICFKGILPQKYLDHLALLVEAVYILLSDEIDNDDIDRADSLILRYVVTYQEYFGKEVMTYNIHLLLHIVKSVRKLGPLLCHNTFVFESENHFLLKLQKSPTNIAIQIARRYLFEKALSPLQKKINVSEPFLKFCGKNLSGRLKNFFEVDGCILIGNGKEYYLNDIERKLFNRIDSCKCFNRFIYNSKRYTSQNYRSCEKIDDSVVLLKNGRVGIIKNICYFYLHETEKKMYIFYEEVIRLRKYFHSSKNVTVHNIEKCLITKNLQICEAKMILQPCMLTSIKNKQYVIFITQGCYGD
ncbi:uncharacterized protein LOC141533026 isoform X2 [Cotesia typhae]|uniref:uncharacterized protein LOC141533026 isoform X2 n=1 Tax=Cotesia typhae TaxID=2053667 RepID=UPI003D69B1BF